MADDSSFEFDNLDEVFNAAAEYLRLNGSTYDNEKLLYFYSRYKQAKEGKCNTPKPSFFDFQGKVKWEAWHKLGDMNKSQAKMEYISLLTNLDQDWRNKMSLVASSGDGGESSGSQARPQGMGVSVSVMSRTESELSEGEKTIFDWCKEGNVDKVKEILLAGSVNVNGLDEEGLGLLHWASDRGLTNMVELLLSLHADINIQASDQQTALHYAVSCDHLDLTKLLVLKGIDISIRDAEGNTAMDVASDDMKLLLQSLQRQAS
ncbi:acyl-CoA-binding domain-containing protein 6-like [Biomphalaria glabrata]|uniref:Acyl-CoA-binding domain-containing protein 6 n=1 Tax=Biomphalaria glabrata TaxID=6526 RepID=A0A2C9LV63_BIOGL|nr:acyl-CoA-binding domain-containing protein 6-like [Biomphalaria glabrata]KAI8779282.1 acyl-CoA-binding domain-containing protein 6 [Biomphalaria glabrata]